MFKKVRRFLGKAYRATKIFMNPTKYAVKLLSDTIRDVGSQYPPQVRNVLSRHGNHKITDIKLCKEVVSDNAEFLIKALAGKNTWEEAKRKHGFDKFYHLFMIVTMDDGSRIHIEKNEIMRVTESPRDCPDALDLGAPSQPMTVSELFERTKQRMGDRNFFTYDPFNNNCQNFVNELLRTMGLLTPSSNSFVFQDIQGLREDLPGYTKYLAKGLTDLGAIVNTAYQKTKDYIVNGEDEGLDNQTNAS
jgi:hypothetical protein